MPNAIPGLGDGARNLLLNCAGLGAGSRLLILREPGDLDYYDPALAAEVASVAAGLGIVATVAEVPFSPVVSDPPEAVAAMMRAADCTLFLARMGDQIRFRAALADTRAVVSYALDRTMLASPFGTLDYTAFVALKTALDDAVAAAERVRVTCPLGTDFEGRAPAAEARQDVNVTRFPMSVFTPCGAAGFSGRIAQRGFLVGTGSQYYEPYACALEATLLVAFDGNRITGFSGEAADVAAAEAQYDRVAETFGIDGSFVHSWHAGIHPGCAYPMPATTNFERWSGAAFGNPRLMHVHTCGAYAPGEISLNVLDPTIRLDGVAVWEAGRLHPERIPGGAEILARHPAVAAAFAAPAQDCGLGPEGRLSAR